MTYREGEWDSALDAIAHGVHAKHGRELEFSEMIAREIFITARSLGIPAEAIHSWAGKRERMLHDKAEEPAAGSDAATQIDLGLLADYRAGTQPDAGQN